MTAAGCPSRGAPAWPGDPERACHLLPHDSDLHWDSTHGWWLAAPDDLVPVILRFSAEAFAAVAR